MAQGYHYQHYDNNNSNIDYSPTQPRTPVSPLLPAQQLPLLRTTIDRNAQQQQQHDQNFHLVSPIMSQTPSIASDSKYSALSAGTGTFPANPANVRPSAAYVAPLGAAQVVSEHQASQTAGALSSDDDDDAADHKPSKDDVSFSPSSLALINAFLDQLLFSFLAAAKSTTLSALRPAVTDILRHKLARDAIASANEELADLLSGGDEEDDKDGKSSTDAAKWDLELVWRRTRLRVMVYMRLGEMEDEDEERYVKEQELFANGDRERFSSTAGLVSWSAAIFLTSVLEHVAEQILRVAGSAAYTRSRRHASSTTKAVVVDEQDAERIALNPALGRLWRSWRKTMRANVRPTTPAARDEAPLASPKSVSSTAHDRDSFVSAVESNHGGDGAADREMGPRLDHDLPDTQYPEHILASNIRLPMGDPLRDVDEIEVPGLARDPSEVGSIRAARSLPSGEDRRRSFSNYISRQTEAKSLSKSMADEGADDQRPTLERKRSNSVPAPIRNVHEAFSTPDEDANSHLDNEKVLASEILHGPIYGPKEEKDFDFTNTEDVDKRKSLIDIKTLLAAINGGQAPYTATTKDSSGRDRPRSAGSDQSFSLGNKENGVLPQQPVAARQHLATGDDDLAYIGVATTSDQAVEPERTSSATGNRGQTASPPIIANNISRASSFARSKYSPDLSGERQAQSTSAGATDEVSARDRPVEPNEQTLAALRESVHRASSPQAAQQGVDNSQLDRKSMATQYPISSFNSQTQPVEHPSLQQRKSVADANKKDQPGMATSASIRGPEDFDQFVQSDEVVKYTLTPEPIRDVPLSNADAMAQLTGEVPLVAQPTASKGTADRSGKAASTTTEELSEAEKKRKRWSVTKPPSRNSSVLRRSGLMAREARVITESTRDFADFIRSTRPDKEPQVQPLVTSQSAASLRNSTNYSLPRSQSVTGDRTRSLTRSDIAAGHAPPVPIIPGKGRSSMQPKAANGATQENGELIAFIRDGPKEDGQHRVSRSIAPFRSTMDSDQFDSLKSSARPSSDARGPGPLNSNPPSNRLSTISKPQVNGISNASAIAHPAYGGGPQPFAQQESNDPQRKRYRNKDPYAIDLDDLDDDEDISALPKNRRTGGESLAEFLRNDDGAKDGDRPIASASSLAQARELKERAARAKGSRNNSVYQAGDEVTALPTGLSKGMESKTPASGRAAGRSETSELADFFRTSGPSAAPAPSVGRGNTKAAAPVKPEKKSRGGFFAFFRKGSSKAKPTRHADMP